MQIPEYKCWRKYQSSEMGIRIVWQLFNKDYSLFAIKRLHNINRDVQTVNNLL